MLLFHSNVYVCDLLKTHCDIYFSPDLLSLTGFSINGSNVFLRYDTYRKNFESFQ